MINHRPVEKFKNVKIKLLKELTSYIQHFEPSLRPKEVQKVAKKLLQLESPVPQSNIPFSKSKPAWNPSQTKTINDMYKDRF
ncbi:MAG: hypothetical protein AAFQ02_07600 [Bacteroidota bacterium]